jgi:hypothetical protein
LCPAAIELRTVTWASGLFVIFFVFVAGPLTSWADRAAASLF